VSTADDCRIEAAILRDALAEIMEARGDHAAARVCREFGPAVAIDMVKREEVARA
jgi:hypothetical protein